jgi:peroxiredoxin
MANDLTGDFDVVAEFTVAAINRVLAAMHRIERVPHTLAVRVDDSPSKVGMPTVVGSVDIFGEPTADHTKIGRPTTPLTGQFIATDPVSAALDPVVNAGLAGVFEEPIVPSHVKGRAQLQLAPPTIAVSGILTRLSVRITLWARYLPDPGTSPLAEFVRGEVQITTGVNQVASQTANVVDIDIKASSVDVRFTPTWTSRPLDDDDLAAIVLVIRNALKTSFLPSNATLPSNIRFLRFKAFGDSQPALAALLNLTGGPGNPASVGHVFLRAGDDFAFAVGRDFILAALPTARDHRFPPVWGYSLYVDSPTIELQPGRIVTTVQGHAHTDASYLPDFSFSVTQAFTLNLVATTPDGPLVTAELAVLGDIDITGVPDPLVDLVNSQVRDSLRQERDANLAAQQPMVRSMLSIERNLGGFLRSLLNPARLRPAAPTLIPRLAYTSFEIQPDGIVLHGSLAVPDWPTANVAFEQVPSIGRPGPLPPIATIPQGPDYSALKTWIPGGTIQRYEWRASRLDPPFHIDDNTFMVVSQPPVSTTISARTLPGYVPLCLTVRGTRITASGPATDQPVAATMCGYNWVSVLGPGLLTGLAGARPLVALTEPGPGGQIEVVGHTPAAQYGAVLDTPNVVVHFADDRTVQRLELLTRAVADSQRGDAPAAVLAILSADQLSRARYTEGVIHGASEGGAWERAFGVKTTTRPVTLLADPTGKIVWRSEGELDAGALTAALRAHLVPARPPAPRLLRAGARIGAPAPNFLFPYTADRELTLRKLAGRPVVLVFWVSTSKPSLDAVRDVGEVAGRAAGEGSVTLAINDGEIPDLARRTFAESGLSATLVVDPERAIGLAYGVTIWPTVVFIDASGATTRIQHGRPGQVESDRQANPGRSYR